MSTRSNRDGAPDAKDVEQWGNCIDSFRDKLTFIARKNLAKSLQTRVSASDIAASTIRTALRKYVQGEAVPPEENLGAWLYAICVKKAQEAARRETRQKRDVRRTNSFVDEAYGGPNIEPAAEYSLAVSTDIVRGYIAAQPDPVDRVILSLAILLPMLDGKKQDPAREIREALALKYDKVLAIRTIQLRIATHRDALRKMLEECDGSDQNERPAN